eukprot:1159049-Pelagomonas_calceolata.AAC.8
MTGRHSSYRPRTDPGNVPSPSTLVTYDCTLSLCPHDDAVSCILQAGKHMNSRYESKSKSGTWGSVVVRKHVAMIARNVKGLREVCAGQDVAEQTLCANTKAGSIAFMLER